MQERYSVPPKCVLSRGLFSALLVHPGTLFIIVFLLLGAFRAAGGQTDAARYVTPVFELGAASGVPGFSDSKWGPMVGVQLGLGRSPVLKWTVEGDYIFIRSAAACCGPPGGFTYDDHGILGGVGLKYSLGEDRIKLELSSGIGVAGYRETRRGSIPGFTPGPTHGWQYAGIGNAGIGLRVSSGRGLSFTAGVREYLGLTSARLGAFRPQGALLLGIGREKP
jgi:hypothetical protein